MKANIALGLEILLAEKVSLIRGARVGLICNPATVDGGFRHAADLFHAHAEINLTALFGPQHGIRGETQDNMIEWEGFRDPRTGVMAWSLYGRTRTPTPEMLHDLDVLVFDVQDVGTRVYTFIYTMALAMKAAREAGKRIVVLDRPNPIGGAEIEGNLLEPGHESFVGMFPIPMRHGMTIGELARMFNEEQGIGCELEVVPMRGYRRDLYFDQTDAPWVLPSPNIPTLDTAVVYPGTVLVEGTKVSEGRGTTRPFEINGAPYADAHELAGALNGLDLPGVHFRPHSFIPTFQKHAGVICHGVQIHVLDRDRFKPVITGVALIKMMRDLYSAAPGGFAWQDPPYEYVFDRLPFDVIAGSALPRRQIEGGASVVEIAASWHAGENAFRARRAKYLLY
ncbi:MAG: exo-beta-N-acetylmuramidase NamZ domain-containing protein [Blastocatellia bacterium]